MVVHYQSPLIWCNKAHIGSSSLALSRYARKLSKIIFFIQSYPIARVINLANDYFNIVVICQPPVACHCHDPVQISWRNCYHTLKQTVEKIEAIMKCTSRGHNENQCLFEKWYRSSLMKNPTIDKIGLTCHHLCAASFGLLEKSTQYHGELCKFAIYYLLEVLVQ